MVRLTAELVDDAMQYINTVRDRELNLRGFKIPAIENLGTCRNQFDTIDLSDNDIRKLDNIPKLPRLGTLLMHNNRIQQIQPDIGIMLPGLHTLVLTNNNICELGDVDPLGLMPKLEYLSLVGNPVTHKPQYRLYVIYTVPSARVLDYKRIRLAERTAAKSMFKGKKGAKLRNEVVKKSKPLESDEPQPVQPSGLAISDVIKIQDAIRNAKSLQEVEQLQAQLQSGRIPNGAGSNGQQRVNAVDDNMEAEEEEDEASG